MSITARCSPQLSATQLHEWREFIAKCPDAHFHQDPAWAQVEHALGSRSRRPHYFWCERDGAVCLTALGVRRRLPVPGRVFWEFRNGPNVLEPDVLGEWLEWLTAYVGRQAARVTLQPARRLDVTGDQMETTLDAHGFVRRRGSGIWTTLLVDLDRSEADLLSSFRPHHRARIRQSQRRGVVVDEENDRRGWAIVAELDKEMAARMGWRPVSPRVVNAIGEHWLGGKAGTVLVARRAGRPLAALLVVGYGPTAHMYLMPSSHAEEKLSTSHLLLWEAMRWAKAQGYATFDLDGYSLSARPGDVLWGINEFKRRFVPREAPLKLVAVHEHVFSPVLVGAATRMRRYQALAGLSWYFPLGM